MEACTSLSWLWPPSPRDEEFSDVQEIVTNSFIFQSENKEWG